MTELKSNEPVKVPWVTFCMTTFKRPDFLRNQLYNLLRQTFQDFAIIISDNDTDASAKAVVAEINDPRIEYYTNEANLGMVKSFNRSLAKAKSEYVVMITDDDPAYPDMLQTLYDLSIAHPGYGIYYGGCDILCTSPTTAHTSRLRVGTNSCLANLPIGTVRKYTGEEFAYAYFDGSLDCHILWSTGIVKRSIAMKIDGMPDFGAPYNTDFGYIVLSGSQEGAVLLNTSLGSQVVHGTNYGFTESNFEKFYITPEGFYKWIFDRFPNGYNYPGLKKSVETFLGRWVVEYAVSIKKYMREKKMPQKEFDKWVDKIFGISFIRKWKLKYYLAVYFPGLFKIALAIVKKIR